MILMVLLGSQHVRGNVFRACPKLGRGPELFLAFISLLIMKSDWNTEILSWIFGLHSRGNYLIFSQRKFSFSNLLIFRLANQSLRLIRIVQTSVMPGTLCLNTRNSVHLIFPKLLHTPILGYVKAMWDFPTMVSLGLPKIGEGSMNTFQTD